MTKKMVIQSLQGAYDVTFFDSLEFLQDSSQKPTGDYYVIIDKIVKDLYGKKLEPLLKYPSYEIEATENSKTLTGVSDFSSWLISQGATKSSTILAIGGGIIQDIATFTAHIYKRGINWEYLPTTLLSQSDSCIGAKCGINLMPYKNQIGVMHSPKRVWIVSEFLTTLDKQVFVSGYGEILKLSLTPPANFYEEFCQHLDQYGFAPNAVLPILRKSLMAKQQIIEVDEYESDLRRILNYGHSFGHALESISKNNVNHGLAVVFGIDLINYLAYTWGVLSEKVFKEIRNTISTYFPTDFLPADITAEKLVSTLKTDKKVSSGKINFAVLNTNFKLVIMPKSIDDELEKSVRRYLQHETIFTSS